MLAARRQRLHLHLRLQLRLRRGSEPRSPGRCRLTGFGREKRGISSFYNDNRTPHNGRQTHAMPQAVRRRLLLGAGPRRRL